MAGVRVTSNRIVVIEESSAAETLRLSTLRYAVIHSILETSPNFPAGQHSIQMT